MLEIRLRRMNRILQQEDTTTMTIPKCSLCIAIFYFPIAYKVCKRRKESSKKNSSPFSRNTCFGCPINQETKTKIPSIHLYVSSVDTITFEGVGGSKQKLVDVF